METVQIELAPTLLQRLQQEISPNKIKLAFLKKI